MRSKWSSGGFDWPASPEPGSPGRAVGFRRALSVSAALICTACTLFNLPVVSPTALPTSTLDAGVILALTPAPTGDVLPEPLASDLLELGVQASAGGNLSLALQYFNEVLEIDPNSADAYFQRGLIYTQTGELDLAMVNFTQALSLRSDFAEASFQRGLIYRQLSDLNAARGDFSQAINLDPSFADAYKYRGLAEAELGLDSVARIDLQVYLALVPDAADKEYVLSVLEDLEAPVFRSPNAPPGTIYFDDFSNEEGGWLSGGSAEGYTAHMYDGYLIIVTIPSSVIWARPTLWFQDVIVEADAELVAGPVNNFYGLFCRFQDEFNFYAFLISSDGFYGIARRIDAGPLELVGMEKMPFSPVILQGEAQNHIRAECLDSTLRLIVNGVLLAEVQDEHHGSGDVGIMAGTYDEPRPNILFDDFMIYQVE